MPVILRAVRKPLVCTRHHLVASESHLGGICLVRMPQFEDDPLFQHVSTRRTCPRAPTRFERFSILFCSLTTFSGFSILLRVRETTRGDGWKSTES